MNINDYRPKFDNVIEHLSGELAGLRTNRATPALIENISVVAYEESDALPLQQLASISVPEARQLLVEPWDKSTLKPIEKALDASDLGLSIANEGSCLRITMPLMTDEIKQKIIRVLHSKLEDARISLRNQREKIKDDIIKQEKDKNISEDERFNLIEDLDSMIREYNDKVKEMGDKKESEINA